jgi:hypothetical protein
VRRAVRSASSTLRSWTRNGRLNTPFRWTAFFTLGLLSGPGCGSWPPGKCFAGGTAHEIKLIVHVRFKRCGAAPIPFTRGDANDDGATGIEDAIAILGFLYLGEPADLHCRAAADFNDSSAVDISDPIYLLRYEVLGGPALPGPFPSCGLDGSRPDELTCESFVSCQ